MGCYICVDLAGCDAVLAGVSRSASGECESEGMTGVKVDVTTNEMRTR